MTAVSPDSSSAERARRLPVPPRPRRATTVTTWIVAVVVVVGLHIGAFKGTSFSFEELVTGWHGMWVFLFGDSRSTGALPPDLHWDIVGPAIRQCLITLSIGLLGTTLSIPVALVLALLGSRATSRNVVVYQLARFLMAFFRAVPSFVWGLIFVTAVGLGAFPGTLAILTHNMGVMGKLWSESMEEADPGQVEALRSSGASSAQSATHAVLPSVLPQFTSLFLYRIDVNVRDSLTLGIVGVGGIGFLLTESIQEFEFNQMMTYLLMVLVMIFAVDLLSAAIRKRLNA